MSLIRNLFFSMMVFVRLQSWRFEGQSWATDDYVLVKLNREGMEKLK